MAKPMSDDAIVARLSYAAGQAVGFAESKLAKERERTRKYYEGTLPARMSGGDSTYVSMDVWESVESMKAQLLEVISASHHPVNFVPAPNEPATAGQARADYCNAVLFNQNPGFSILQMVLDDGLMCRAGIVKAYWKTDSKKESYDLSDTTMEELTAHMAENPKAEIEDYEVHESGETIKRVRLSTTKDRSRIVLENVPPEEFGISPMASSIATAEVVIHRRRMTTSDLIKAGYDRAKIESLQSDDKAWEAQDGDRWQRFSQTDDMVGDDELGEGSEARRRCMVIEAYAELDVDGTGVSRLHKVTYVGTTLLDKEPVERTPFVAFVPLPRAHAFWGTAYAKLSQETQTARTYLTRSILNHAMITNNPRLQVVRGAVLNPRELMENRIGGIVNVTRPDGIAPIPQQGLNPFVFQTIAMLDDGKESITGISKLSQGLNKDAISSQNSQGMVEQLISASQTRQKVIARNFAENFLRHLFTMIYRLVLENEDPKKIISVAGSWTPIDLTSWPEDAEVEISLTLGYNEQQKESQKWMGIDAILSGPTRKQFYNNDKQFAVLSRAMQATGVKNIGDYMLSPKEIQPPPPDPMHEADIAVKQADAASKNAAAQASTAGIALKQQEFAEHASEAKAKLHLATLKEQDHASHSTAQLAQHTANQADVLAHSVAMDAANLKLDLAALAQQKLTATAATRG